MREDHFTNTPEAAARYDRDTFADLYDEAPEHADYPTEPRTFPGFDVLAAELSAGVFGDVA